MKIQSNTRFRCVQLSWCFVYYSFRLPMYVWNTWGVSTLGEYCSGLLTRTTLCTQRYRDRYTQFSRDGANCTPQTRWRDFPAEHNQARWNSTRHRLLMMKWLWWRATKRVYLQCVSVTPINDQTRVIKKYTMDCKVFFCFKPPTIDDYVLTMHILIVQDLWSGLWLCKK